MADGKANPLPKHLPAIPRTPDTLDSAGDAVLPVDALSGNESRPSAEENQAIKGERSHIDPTDPDQIEEPGFDARQPDHLDLRGW